MKSILFFLTLSICLSLQASEKTSQHHFAIELDPAPFILKGYSVSLKYSPKNMPRLGIMGSIYSSDFPDGMMSQSNRDKGWSDMKIETSYALLMEYFLKDNRRGFYAGPAIFLYNRSVALESANSRAEFRTILPNLRVGYIWYPFKKTNLYVNPWLNVGSELNIDSNNSINGTTFLPESFTYIMALHIGYSFSF